MENKNLIDKVDERTSLAGKNRIEILLFKIRGEQLYGINVFKVREVVSMSSIEYSTFPGRNANVVGMTHLRGQTIDLIDLSGSIGLEKYKEEDFNKKHVIVAEFNRTVQGFLVDKVEKIINISWEDISRPPDSVGRNNYLTAIAKGGNDLIEILDVEKILSEVVDNEVYSDFELKEYSEPCEEFISEGIPPLILIDDSRILHKQVTSIFKEIGVGFIRAWDGEEGAKKLNNLAEFAEDINKELLMVILDLEMPKRDGYSLLKEIREKPELKDLHVCIHSSISGVFNEKLIKEIGADKFLTKFDKDQLKGEIELRIRNWKNKYIYEKDV